MIVILIPGYIYLWLQTIVLPCVLVLLSRLTKYIYPRVDNKNN
jgi:hypothetical protein